MNPSRRSLLFMFGASATAFALPGCSWDNPCANGVTEYPDGSLPAGCNTSDAIQTTALAGLDQYELLAMYYDGEIPATELEFQVLQPDGEFAYPNESDFTVDDGGVWRYYFREGDVVAFAPIANTI